MQNKKGFSLLEMLITVLIIAVLATIVLKKYQTINAMEQKRMQQALQPFQPAGQNNSQNTLEQIRSSIKDIEKSAARRAEQQENMYK